MLPLGILVNSFLAEMAIILAFILTVGIAVRFSGLLFKALFAFLTNSILGIVAIFAINAFLAIGIPFSAPVMLSTVLFGLPGVGTLVILKLGGLALA